MPSRRCHLTYLTLQLLTKKKKKKKERERKRKKKKEKKEKKFHFKKLFFSNFAFLLTLKFYYSICVYIHLLLIVKSNSTYKNK